jgi:FAD/FMN-containing dehydrogenase
MTSPFTILKSGHASRVAHPHESFSSKTALEHRLLDTVKGEVRFEDASRALYATDASNYRQVPIGLVIPRDRDDVVSTIGACREFGAPVLSPGGGAGLAGSCCNVAVVASRSNRIHREMPFIFPKYWLAIVDQR